MTIITHKKQRIVSETTEGQNYFFFNHFITREFSPLTTSGMAFDTHRFGDRDLFLYRSYHIIQSLSYSIKIESIIFILKSKVRFKINGPQFWALLVSVYAVYPPRTEILSFIVLLDDLFTTELLRFEQRLALNKNFTSAI